MDRFDRIASGPEEDSVNLRTRIPVGRETESGYSPPRGLVGEQTWPASVPSRPALNILRSAAPLSAVGTLEDHTRNAQRIEDAAREVSYYHVPNPDQQDRHNRVSEGLSGFLRVIVSSCPSGPDRDEAIRLARAAKMFASAGIALEGR